MNAHEWAHQIGVHFGTRITRMGERLRDKESKRLKDKETKRERDKKMKRLREEEIKSRREEETKPRKPLAINSNKPFLERSACRLQHHQRKLRFRCCGSRRHLRGRTAFQADTEGVPCCPGALPPVTHSTAFQAG